MELKDKLLRIKLVCLDIDGVMSDGHIHISDEGELFKTFFVRDGLGIKFLMDAGIQVAICTGRTSQIVETRAKELGITLVMQGEKDKREGFAKICKLAGVTPDQVAYMGDDIPDLCLFDLVALSCAPADCSDLIRTKVDWISRFNGGHGAIRELSELILGAQGKLSEVIQKRFKVSL